jgi:hypothetical protein
MICFAFKVANIREKIVSVKKKRDKKSIFFRQRACIFQKKCIFAAVLIIKTCSRVATSKRFHKFWFLVLENPDFSRDFLVLGYQ